jgi:hypothetical protein
VVGIGLQVDALRFAGRRPRLAAAGRVAAAACVGCTDTARACSADARTATGTCVRRAARPGPCHAQSAAGTRARRTSATYTLHV